MFCSQFSPFVNYNMFNDVIKVRKNLKDTSSHSDTETLAEASALEELCFFRDGLLSPGFYIAPDEMNEALSWFTL